MPFAQFGYPHRNADEFADRYPADFICEAIDQTRGWFYTLMAIGTLTFDQNAYRNVLCLGHILDEDGRKMSKHLGNVLDPIQLMDEHGADSVRWFMLASGSPWQARRVGHHAIAEVWRRTLLTYWSCVSFQALYAKASGWDAAAQDYIAVEQRSMMDQWALSAANSMLRDVDAALERFDTQRAGAALEAFIEDLSNWYIRRSRRRFWDGDPAALLTLHECLRLLTGAMAPFTPFITERVWQDLFRPVGAVESVHLSAWPQPDEALIDDELDRRMRTVRRLVELGRTARAESGLGVRQPLGAALISAPGWDDLPDELRGQITAELNVNELKPLSEATDLVDVSVKPNFRSLGRRFGKSTPTVAKAVAAADPQALADGLRAGEDFSLPVPELGDVTLTSDDVVVTETPREGWAVAAADGHTLALDLHLTDELRRAGLARNFIRLVQEARKDAGFDVSDRITLRWRATDEQTHRALSEHAQLIAAEVLASRTEPDVDLEQPVAPEGYGFEFEVLRGA